MLSKDVAIVNGMVRTKDSVKMKDTFGVASGEKISYKGFVIQDEGHSGRHWFRIYRESDMRPADISSYPTMVQAKKQVDSLTRDSKTKDENLKEKLIRLAEQAGDKEYADDIRNGKVPLSQSELVRRIDWYTTRTVGQ